MTSGYSRGGSGGRRSVRASRRVAGRCRGRGTPGGVRQRGAAAFRACVAASGGPLSGMVHPGVVTAARVASALSSVLSGPSPATALITGNVATTIEALRYLGADAGRLALVGFDDFPLADILRPGLTVVAQNSAAIGRTAIDLLVARAADPSRPVQTVTVPVELIARGSGELPPS